MYESVWNGFKRLDFVFEGRDCILIFPDNECDGKKWLYKTEYFDAFPNTEIEMLKKGYYVAHIKNTTRMCPESDTDMRPKFCEYLSKQFGLNSKCALIGMSCGGMQAVYFTAKYPQYVACAYLDAPVMNYLSWPFALGIGQDDSSQEFIKNMGFGLPVEIAAAAFKKTELPGNAPGSGFGFRRIGGIHGLHGHKTCRNSFLQTGTEPVFRF